MLKQNQFNKQTNKRVFFLLVHENMKENAEYTFFSLHYDIEILTNTQHDHDKKKYVLMFHDTFYFFLPH